MISVSSTAAVKKGNMGRAWAIVLVVFLAGFCMPANMGKTMWLAPLVMQGLEFGPDVHESGPGKRHPRLERRHVHRHPDVLRTMLCVQAKGAIEMLRENWDGAVSLFERTREMARKCGSVQVDAEASLALAVLFEQRGDHDQAMVELVRSLKLSLKEGNVGVYFRYGAHARDLLLEVATSRKAARPLRDFAKRVLSLADTDDAAPEAEELQDELSLGLYALTSREQEVLKMLNAGMSRKEIGTAMSISENTVKSHLKNVYSKLDVHTRSEAYRATLESGEGQENA